MKPSFTTGRKLSCLGAAVFALALLVLLLGGETRSVFKLAGWLVTGGCLRERWDARLWPFANPATVRRIRKVGAKALYFIVVVFASLAMAALIALLMSARMNR